MKNIYFTAIGALLLGLSSQAQPIRNWATYYGGTGDELYTGDGNRIAVDASGNVYLAGYTNSTNSISTVGSHQPSLGGSYDAFLVKFNSAGVRQWATYYGGSGNEYELAIATDASGNIYISGRTTSNSGISTVGSHQVSYAGGTDDGFIAKFNSAGVRQWGTYYGGPGSDVCSGVAVDPVSGNINISGSTNSSSGISTVGSHQAAFGGGSESFLVQFNPSGVRQWATYYGGTVAENAYGVACDASGNIFLTGLTTSSNAISTAGAHQLTNAGGTYDAFLVKFNSSGVRQWGTYYGGSDLDYTNAVNTDASGNVYLAGITGSTNNISSPGSHQLTLSSVYDAFLTKFDANGVRQWGTYYGDQGTDYGYSVSTDAAGDIFFVGETSSTVSISTPGSYQPNYGGGYDDVFIIKFNSAGVRLWGTYYGGDGVDERSSVVCGPSGFLYVAGVTSSTAGISTPGSHQPAFGGGAMDIYVAQFNGCSIPSQPGVISGSVALCTGAGSNVYSVTAVAGATIYNWTLPGGWTGTSTTNVISASPGTSGVFSVSASNACGTGSVQTLSVTVNPLPAITASTSTTSLCIGDNATLTAGGGLTYSWTPGGTGTMIVISPSVNTTYTVTGTDNNGCQNTAVITQTVTDCSTTGIDELQNPDKQFELYPNPFDQKITVVLKQGTTIQVYNATGTLIYNSVSESEKTEINLNAEPSGIYFIRAGSVTRKIVKQ